MTERDPRYDVTRTDGSRVEVVRDLDRYSARRLVEADLNAGRTAAATERREQR